MAYYVTIDIGGTAVKYALADETGRFWDKGETPTGLPGAGIPHLLSLLADIVHRYQARCKVEGVGLDTAGVVDAEKGTILLEARNFPGYTGTGLKAWIEDRCHIPCTVENDVNAAALGEYWLGAGKGARSLVCITVGTGIGGALLLDGRLIHGASGSAGEVGYMHIEGGERDLEASARVPWLLETVARAKGMDVTDLDGRKVFDLAEQGDRDAEQAVATMLHRLALGIGNVCCVFNPQRILLGGGIMARQAYIRPRLDAELEQLVDPALRVNTRIGFAALGNDAGMIGALRNLLDKVEKKGRIG